MNQNEVGSLTADQQETKSTRYWASLEPIRKALDRTWRATVASLRRRSSSNKYPPWFSTHRLPCTDAVRPMDDGGRKLDTITPWLGPLSGGHGQAADSSSLTRPAPPPYPPPSSSPPPPPYSVYLHLSSVLSSVLSPPPPVSPPHPCVVVITPGTTTRNQEVACGPCSLLHPLYPRPERPPRGHPPDDPRSAPPLL
jgi:hypothetical protein